MSPVAAPPVRPELTPRIDQTPEPIVTTNPDDYAARGATWLDEVQPGWFRSVSPDVTISSAQGCVFGQLEGSFLAGLAAFRVALSRVPVPGAIVAQWGPAGYEMGYPAACWLGFIVPPASAGKSGFYSGLTTAWRREVGRRQDG